MITSLGKRELAAMFFSSVYGMCDGHPAVNTTKSNVKSILKGYLVWKQKQAHKFYLYSILAFIQFVGRSFAI